MGEKNQGKSKSRQRRKYTDTTEPKVHVAIGEGKTDGDISPDMLPELLEAGSDPHKSMIAAAKACGMDEEVTRRMLDRLKSEFQPVLGEMRKVKTTEILKALEDRAYRALMYMDDYALAKSSAKDLAVIAGIMLEKRALLRGEPTQILSIDDRSNMNELLPALLKEASKRGMFVDVIDGMVDVTPGSPEREYRPRSKMSLQDRGRKHRQAKKDDEGDPS